MKVRRFMVLRALAVVAREDRLFEVDEGSPGLKALEESRSGGWNAFERAQWSPYDRADHIVGYAYVHARGVQRSPAAKKQVDIPRAHFILPNPITDYPAPIARAALTTIISSGRAAEEEKHRRQ